MSAPTTPAPGVVPDAAARVQAWEEWHRGHEERRAAPHGFLAITSLRWLDERAQRFDDAPGAWSTGPDGVVVDLDDGEQLEVDGRLVTGRHSFGVLPERVSLLAGWGDAVIEVARRGGHDVLRPRHPHGPVRAAYRGTPTYPPRERWVVAARYVAFDAPRPTRVGSVVDGLEHVYDAVGRLDFSLDGRPLSLTAFEGATPGALLVLFTDATSGVTTCAANRSLGVEAPAADGSAVVDLNRAVNLPCAYTDLATCPLPPAENRLPVAVEAGEQLPPQRGGAS